MFPLTKGDGLATMPQQNHADESAKRPLAFELDFLSKIYHRGKGTTVCAVDNLNLSVRSAPPIALDALDAGPAPFSRACDGNA